MLPYKRVNLFFSGFEMNKDMFGIKAIVNGLVQKRKETSEIVEMTVGQLGFSEGANPIAINKQIKELGFEEFSDKQLLHAAKNPGRIYSPGAVFILRKRK